MKNLLFSLALLTTLSLSVSAQEYIRLWQSGKMPNSKGIALTDSISKERIYRVGNPVMYRFSPSQQENSHTAIVICPGGGYERLAYIISGFQLAKWFNTLGITAFVLIYRLPTSPDLADRKTGHIMDAQRALKIIRASATGWDIDSNKIGIMGISAGGHLAAMAGTTQTAFGNIGDTLQHISGRPNFMILLSPVIDLGPFAHKGSRDNLLGPDPDEKTVRAFSPQFQVNASTAPAFIVHAANDQAVSPLNSVIFYEALLKNKVSASLHVFPYGEHAIGLRNNPGSTQYWTELCEAWLTELRFLPAKR